MVSTCINQFFITHLTTGNELENFHFRMGIAFESLAVRHSHIHVVHVGDLELHAIDALHFESVQNVQLINVTVGIRLEIATIDGKFELTLGQTDCKLELLIQHERESSAGFLLTTESAKVINKS